MLNYIKKQLIKWAEERDELLMKQEWGDKPGEYRPKTLDEIRIENPNKSEEVINYLYEWELECWNLKDPDPIVLTRS